MSDPHEHDEDPEECIGEPVADPWDDEDEDEDEDEEGGD